MVPPFVSLQIITIQISYVIVEVINIHDFHYFREIVNSDVKRNCFNVIDSVVY